MNDRIEAAAREAFWTDDIGGHHKQGARPHTWENIPERGRDNYRTLVRAVLAAVERFDKERASTAGPPDSALGRCRVLLQCHRETGHAGGHEAREASDG